MSRAKKNWDHLVDETGNYYDISSSQGVKGQKGERGQTGTKGDDGQMGRKGTKGDIGPAGPVFIWRGQVPTAVDLPVALPGTNGWTYQTEDTGFFHVSNGNRTYSVIESLDVVKGDKGNPGNDGGQGVKGEEGVSGEKGTKGEKGEKGAEGEKGEEGVDGLDGTSVKLYGSVSNLAALDALPGPHNDGDMYVVVNDGSGIANQAYVWSSNPEGWTLVGPIVGPKGEPGTNGRNGTNGTKGEKGVSSQFDIKKEGNTYYLSLN